MYAEKFNTRNNGQACKLRTLHTYTLSGALSTTAVYLVDTHNTITGRVSHAKSLNAIVPRLAWLLKR